MDRNRAKKIANKLEGKKVGAWTIYDYIDNGKSAIILKAAQDKEQVAIKIFDPDLVERLGREKQLARVQREKELIGKKHPNLIEILDGGECAETGYIFVVMAYLPGKNLSNVIHSFPRNRIFPLIMEIASAAKFLEDMGLAHRDIKPQNVVVSHDFSHATLLDLGVIRPVGLSEITDDTQQKVFVGTLRYSPPELLYREEQDNLEGWKAITFYQLGAVLHDMIMRRKLFSDYSDPYAKLVDAVRNVIPEIKADDLDSHLVFLTRSCLLKNPQERLSLVSWDDFLNPRLKSEVVEEIRERIIKRKALAGAEKKKAREAQEKNTSYKRASIFKKMIESIKEITREICVQDKECFPPFERIYSVKSDTNETILICFSPSEQYSLNVALTLGLKIKLIDDAEEIIDLKFLAFASNMCLTSIEDINLDDEKLYRGPYESSLIKDKICRLLLLLIEKGQELELKEVVEKKLAGLEDTIQLSFELKK